MAAVSRTNTTRRGETTAAMTRFIRSGAFALSAAVVLAAVLAVQAWQAFPRQAGIDFYQFWGIPLAKEASSLQQTPYADPARYAQALNAMADSSGNPKLRSANRLRRDLEPMGTPFLYAAFSFFPRDYEIAQGLYTALQYLAAGLAIVLLARLRGLPPALAVCLALIIELTFDPFSLELKVGNVNSLQLLFAVALLAIAARRLYTGHALVDGLFVAALAVLVIFKPNTPWIALALGLHYWTVAGTRKFLVAAGLAAVLGALALACGARYFGGAGAWAEWIGYARGLDGTALPLTLDQGNLSIGMLLAERTRSYGPLAYGAILAAILIVALVSVMSSTGRRSDVLAATAAKCFSDPWFAASLGVLLTFATSPLVWPHYLLLALIPIFWLFADERAPRLGTACALLCYGALARPVIDFAVTAGYPRLAEGLMVCSWMALLPGLFAFVRRQHQELLSSRTDPT